MPSHVPDLLILSGPPGVGKTTVAACLRTIVPGTVVIDGDALRAFAPSDAREVLGPGSTYRAAAVLAGAYLSMGAARVVVDYVFQTARHVEYFTGSLTPVVRPQLFTLWAPLEAVVAREASRIGRARLGDAVPASHSEIERNLTRLGRIVDSTRGDARTVAAAVHELALAGAGRV